jgi:hypothetical protein
MATTERIARVTCYPLRLHRQPILDFVNRQR